MNPPDTLTRPNSSHPPAGASDRPPTIAPPAKLRRRPMLLALSVLFVVLGSLIAVWLVSAIGSTRPIVGIRQDVARGAVIERDDLVVLDITPGPGLQTVPGPQLAAMVGKHAATDLAAGSILTPAQVTDQNIPAAGESLVGISLSPAQLPSEPLKAGDQVRLVLTPREQDDPPATTPRSIAAEVVSSRQISDQGQLVVNVTLPQASAAQMAAAAATGRVALILDSSS